MLSDAALWWSWIDYGTSFLPWVVTVIGVAVLGWSGWHALRDRGEPAPSGADKGTSRREVRPIEVRVAGEVEAEVRDLDEILAEERERAAKFEEMRDGYLREQGGYFDRQNAIFPSPFVNFIPSSSTMPDPCLYISFRWWGDWRLLCIVESPSGHVSSGITFGSIFHQGNNFSLSYPRDFSDAPSLEPGTWVFQWARVAKRTIDGWKVGATVAVDRVEITHEMFALMISAKPVVHHESVGA